MHPEHSPLPEHVSERRKNIRRLKEEFKYRLTQESYTYPLDTEGVVVLSAPPGMAEGEIIERTAENEARIAFAIDAIKDITAQQLNKTVEDLTDADILEHGPPLILNGETEQLTMMQEVALEYGYPQDKIEIVNCGDRGVGNTKTQFEALRSDNRYSHSNHLTFVTTSYHAPRTLRTAAKQLPQQMTSEIIGIPHKDLDILIARAFRGEVKRILDYSEKGDIELFTDEEE